MEGGLETGTGLVTAGEAAEAAGGMTGEVGPWATACAAAEHLPNLCWW